MSAIELTKADRVSAKEGPSQQACLSLPFTLPWQAQGWVLPWSHFMAEVRWFRQGINISHCYVLWWHHGRLRWPSCFSKNVSRDRLQLLSGSVCLEKKMKGTQIGMHVTTQDGCVLLSQCVSPKPCFEFWRTHSHWSHPTTVTMTHLLCHNAFVFSRTSCKWVHRILPGNCWAISPCPSDLCFIEPKDAHCTLASCSLWRKQLRTIESKCWWTYVVSFFG